ncbi:MAG: hypothetical protein B2I17_02985 [Thermoplasmatales archaeon B_DKE]|nr:MAG: hypothetical protein B2I17_02985 [Thermoplasmatales archaeon B_DKE]QRF75687.1 putative copper-exporting P-type ATPase B [Thermoplasmatales archaeon]
MNLDQEINAPITINNAHSVGVEDALSLLKTSRMAGLKATEASRRLTVYGPNKLEREPAHSALRILVSQFNSSLVIILLGATIISFFLGEIVDSIVILIIVALVAALGFSQEYRTEGVLSALKKMRSLRAFVVRDGNTVDIDVEEIVPGDVVIISAGDKISADMRLLESFNLLVDEAPLTGESTQVEKSVPALAENTPVADRCNMLFSGTSVTNGKGVAVCISTGMNTELGKITRKVTERYPKSSSNIEKRMNEIGRRIGIIVLILIIIIVTIALSEQLYLTGSISSGDVISILLFGVALGVAAIPEALPAVLAGSLAIGAYRMAKENALTRNLSAVETLGSTQVICTDKTGTLTKGEMTAVEIRTVGNTFSVSGTGYDPSGTVEDRENGQTISIPGDLGLAMSLCNDALLMRDEDDKRWIIKGDTTEGALVVLAEKLGFRHQTIRSGFPRTWEIPFSSESKRMITVHRPDSGEEIAYMKGAPETVLEVCTQVLGRNGIESIDESLKRNIMGNAESMAERSFRVLAIAMRHLSGQQHTPELIEREFTFLGLVGMIDPPRPEAIEAISKAKKIGIRPIMITGDHRTTAIAIGTQMGIFQVGDLSLTGEQLQRMDEKEYETIVEDVTVYARVTPFDKLRIVEAWQKKNKLVAMTGDGVNDAPALKRADIGIAMGIAGTEVAKEASDMILLDDNFATILKAVSLGRWVQDNVKKYLAYLLSANLVEIVVLSMGALIASLFMTGTSSEPLVPLLAVQILYINLATDGIPALQIGISPPEPDLMERKVQETRETTVFSPEVRRFIYLVLAAEVPLLFIIYLTGIPAGIEEARTRLFLAIILVELALALTLGSLRYPVYKVRPHKWLVVSIVWEVILMVGLIITPTTRHALQLVYPTIGDIEWAIFAAIFSFAYIEILKHFPARDAR